MAEKKNKRGQNEGSIRKKEKNGKISYEARVTIDYKQISRTFKTRTEASAWLAEARTQQANGTFIKPDKVTLGEWLPRWLEVYIKPGVKPSTYANYMDVTNKHIIPSLGPMSLQALRGHIIKEFYNKKLESGRLDGKGGLSQRIINLMHQVIKGALKQAVFERLIPTNPAEHITNAKIKHKEMNTLSPEQANKYLEAAEGERLKAAFLLEIHTGLRRGELLGLTWDSIDLEGEEPKLQVKQTLARVRLVDKGTSELMTSEPKTEKSKRTIYIDPAIAEELKHHKARQEGEKEFHGKHYQDNGYVFTTAQGRPIEPRNFYRLHCKVLEDASLPHVRFHDLRHSVATMLIQDGENVENIRELLGHEKTSTTLDLYCHSTPVGAKRTTARLAQIISAQAKDLCANPQ